MMHYIACGGLHGCICTHSQAYDDYSDAVNDLANTYDLQKAEVERLAEEGYIYLSLQRDGNEYCEIIECDCEDPTTHDD